MTDYKALCADLLSAIDDDISFRTNVSGHASPDALRFSKAVLSARNALAQHEPEVPTDEELWAAGSDDFRANCYPSDAIAYARAVLAKWGRQ
jgi:hypothetical protein